MKIIIEIEKFDKKKKDKFNNFLLNLFGKSKYEVEFINDKRIKKHESNLIKFRKLMTQASNEMENLKELLLMDD